MIRRLPSISTTGSVGPSRTRKYGSASSSRAAWSCSIRSCSRALAKTIDRGGHLRSGTFEAGRVPMSPCRRWTNEAVEVVESGEAVVETDGLARASPRSRRGQSVAVAGGGHRRRPGGRSGRNRVRRRRCDARARAPVRRAAGCDGWLEESEAGVAPRPVTSGRPRNDANVHRPRARARPARRVTEVRLEVRPPWAFRLSRRVGLDRIARVRGRRAPPADPRRRRAGRDPGRPAVAGPRAVRRARRRSRRRGGGWCRADAARARRRRRPAAVL